VGFMRFAPSFAISLSLLPQDSSPTSGKLVFYSLFDIDTGNQH
jgi:hypothetical protein